MISAFKALKPKAKSLRPGAWLLAALAFSGPKALAKIEIPELPSKNQPLSFKLQKEFFRSHSNYSSFGKYLNLPNENSFTYLGLHPSLRYAPFPYYLDFEIFAESFYAATQNKSQRRSVYRPTIAGAGLRAYYKHQNFYMGFEFRSGHPLYGNFRTADEIILGGGAFFVEPGLWLIFKPSQTFYIYYNSAFRHRMFSLAGLWFNRLGGVFQAKHAEAGLAVDSFFSAKPDALSASPEIRWDALEKVNAGSYKFFSVNPAALSFTAWMELKFKPVFATLYINLDTIGQNYARGLTLGMITKWRVNLGRSSFLKQRADSDLEFDEEDAQNGGAEKEKEYFEEEADAYDQKEIKQELRQELKQLKY